MTREVKKQAAAVCYKRCGEVTEFLLIRTRGHKKRWTFPKGSVEDHEKSSTAAKREAFEEAGIIGTSRPRPFAYYSSRGRKVSAYLVECISQINPREEDRRPRWLTVEKALGKLSLNRGHGDADELNRVLLKAGALVNDLPTKVQAAKGRSASAGVKSREHIFISYSHKDKEWLEQIQTMLRPNVRGKKILMWDDTKIKPGLKWKKEIKDAIGSAAIALLLVSRHFLASDFIHENELPPLLDAAKNEGLIVLWVALSASMHEGTILNDYQALNKPSKPLDELSKKKVNRQLKEICQGIQDAFDQRCK